MLAELDAVQKRQKRGRGPFGAAEGNNPAETETGRRSAPSDHATGRRPDQLILTFTAGLTGLTTTTGAGLTTIAGFTGFTTTTGAGATTRTLQP